MHQRRKRYEAPPESPGFFNYKRKNFVPWDLAHEVFAHKMAEFDRLPRAVRDVWNEHGKKTAMAFMQRMNAIAKGKRPRPARFIKVSPREGACKMTWKEFKDAVEAKGVKDDTEIEWIDTSDCSAKYVIVTFSGENTAYISS